MLNHDPDSCLSAVVTTISTVRRVLDETFARLNACCDYSEEILHHRPLYPQAWTAAEHLEHVCLANHFLLLTISKGVATALRRAETQTFPNGGSYLTHLAPIAEPDTFTWEPPDHMIPSGTLALIEIQERLAAQHRHCRDLLERMGKGEGTLCSFRMSVFNLGRLDMYQWLFFLAQHGRWHLEFLARRDMV